MSGPSLSQGLLACVFIVVLVVGGRRGAALRGHSAVCRLLWLLRGPSVCLIPLRIRSVMWGGSSRCQRGLWMWPQRWRSFNLRFCPQLTCFSAAATYENTQICLFTGNNAQKSFNQIRPAVWKISDLHKVWIMFLTTFILLINKNNTYLAKCFKFDTKSHSD